ncbi:MAG: hypothetical protein RIQ93_2383 [Verrucomicrobiota bacterium]|jgi:LacI family transcriptional regulator
MQTIPKRLTLVHQVEAILRDGIRTGQWGGHLPGEMELCRKLQVSRTTLRAAMLTLTRERWLRSSQGQRRRIVKEGKVPEAQVTGRVVLVSGVPLDVMSGTPIFVVDDLRQQLAKAGFELEVHASRTWFAQRPEAALERLARARRPAAWVLFRTTLAVQRWFAAQGLPCVLLGSCHAGITLPTIDVDFYALGQHAARQFLSRGHRHIALLLPALGMAGEVKMINGVRSVTSAVKGVELRVVEHDGTPPVVRRRVASLFQRSPPTGLLVAGAAYVVTVLTELARSGVRIPEDLSLISRDREPFLDFVVPSLTRYVMNPVRYAQRLSRTVVTLAQGGSAPVRAQLLLPQFALGETLAYLSRRNTSRP